MKKDKLSRRDFLKVTLLGLGAAVLAACKKAIQPLTDIATITPTTTNTPKPTSTKTQTPTPTETATPTDIPCLSLLAPPNGAELPSIGRVKFEWEIQPGATKYRLELTLPNLQIEEYETELTSFEKYLESLPLAGEYSWQVVALDGSENTICIAEPFTFTKPKYEKPNSGGNNGDSSTVSTTGTVVPTVDTVD